MRLQSVPLYRTEDWGPALSFPWCRSHFWLLRQALRTTVMCTARPSRPWGHSVSTQGSCHSVMMTGLLAPDATPEVWARRPTPGHRHSLGPELRDSADPGSAPGRGVQSFSLRFSWLSTAVMKNLSLASWHSHLDFNPWACDLYPGPASCTQVPPPALQPRPLPPCTLPCLGKKHFFMELRAFVSLFLTLLEYLTFHDSLRRKTTIFYFLSCS